MLSVIFGTHTHIPTADAKILPGGSAFISDLGMCGPYDSVLGRRKDRVREVHDDQHAACRSTSRPATCGCAALLAEIDEETGRALSIERIEVQGDNAEQAYDADDKSPPQNNRNHTEQKPASERKFNPETRSEEQTQRSTEANASINCSVDGRRHRAMREPSALARCPYHSHSVLLLASLRRFIRAIASPRLHSLLSPAA